ncbi:unnamed protein product [Alopecurus aequalis]
MSACADPEKAIAPVAAGGGEEEKAEVKPELEAKEDGSGGELPSPMGVDIPSAATDSNKRTNYKNRLQEWTQRNYLELPVYLTVSKGEPHKLEFRSTVKVGGKPFPSDQCHSRLKDAEQDAARVAYESLVPIDDDSTDVLGLIDQGVVFCKSILNEFAVKTKVTQPTYSVGCPEGLAHMPIFVSSVLLAGSTYTGEAAPNKKVAEQKAAHVAVKSILATNNNCMEEIIRSKKQLIVAMTSSGFNKERVVSQENCNAPTNALTTVAPIKFVRAVGDACPTADQGADIIPAAHPSAQVISSSKKRKKHIITAQDVTHRNMSN